MTSRDKTYLIDKLSLIQAKADCLRDLLEIKITTYQPELQAGVYVSDSLAEDITKLLNEVNSDLFNE